MIPSARPRRLQGRFVFFLAIASLFLLSLFLWRTADPRTVDPRLSAAVANAKQTVGNEHSSPSLIHDSDEYLDDYEYLSHSQDEHIDLKPTPIVQPFSLSLPPASSSISTSSLSAVQSHDVIPTEPAQTPAAKASPSIHPGDSVSTSQNPRISGKPDNLTISGFVFYGRRDRTESMHCYLERNLVTHGGWLDNVIWVVNTQDEADLAYLDKILARSPLYKTHVLPEQVGWPDYAKIWRIVDRETMYIKIDDDIVWFADDTIERLVKRKLERRDALAVSANIINNPPLSFLHYHMGALHPYFPDLPKGFDYNTLKPPPPEPSKEEEEEAIYEEVIVSAELQPIEETIEIVGIQPEESQPEKNEKTFEAVDQEEEHSTLSKRLATFGHKTPWRPSEHPNWTGPDNFEWSLDWTPPPFQNHRWLRVPDDKALNRTPVAQLTYDVWGPTYESWAIASQQHYSLLENIETEKLDLYKFDHPWDMKGERIRINFLAILGSDVLDMDVFNWPDNQGDEDMLVLTLPHDTGRPILIEGTALAAHFNFQHQGGVTTTDLLSRYKSLAAEQACLVPSPSAFD
ncbi:hypothetical protein ZTR_06373 [Talaromyces verruculosus]|nr:hypothetical protein ZTR_06373 [Talaromyces verruculosus]